MMTVALHCRLAGKPARAAAFADNHIPLVDADPPRYAIFLCDLGIVFGHAALPFGCTTQCINHTGKFD
jgi:hypothetical protein